MDPDGDRLPRAAGDSPRVATAGAVVCAGLAVVVAAATALITFGLSRSYGFGPAWDWSAFVMTGAAAALAGTALFRATRLARLRLRPILVFAASVASVFMIGYVAGILGDRMHQ